MTDKTKIVSARMPKETVAELEKRLENQGITLRELLTGYANGSVDVLPAHGGEKSRSTQSVNTDFDGISHEVLENIKSMIHLFGMSPNGFASALNDAMENGVITVERMEIVPVQPPYMEKFYDKCRELNMTPEAVMDKIMKMMR